MSYEEIAKRCRVANAGYDDEAPGSPEDVLRRLDKLERDLRSYAEGNAHLHARLARAED